MKTKINKEKIKKSIKTILLILLLTIIFLYLNKRFSFYIPCIFHKITHLYCPGCGLTRMIISIFKLNFYQAFRYNPLLFIMMPFIITYEIKNYINWIQDKPFTISKKIWYTLLFITIIYTILRNINMFNYLAPTKI